MKKVVIILVILGAVLAATFFIILSLPNPTEVITPSSKSPVAPATSLNGSLHNFGIIWLDDGPSPQEHEFEIRNDSDKTLTVAGVTVSCECVTPTFDKKSLLPGETGTLKVVMDLPGATYKDVDVWLNFGDDGIMTLNVVATGRRKITLDTFESIVKLLPSGDTQNNQLQADIILFASVNDDDNVPGEPEVTMPEGLTVEFLGWKKVTDEDKHLPGQPIMWQSTIRFTEVTTVDEPCFILITLGKSGYTKVALQH